MMKQHPPDSFAERAIHFYQNLEFDLVLPDHIRVMNPYKNDDTLRVVRSFFKKYYSDNNLRTYILGINPGRMGGGLTGISFTDPVALRDSCMIPNSLGFKKELSSEFIYLCVEAYGGPESFFRKFYLGAVCPLGFVKKNRNYNYYDSPELLKLLAPYLQSSFLTQMAIGADRNNVICLGAGKNFDYLTLLNKKYQIFDNIQVLDHPRYIMQYKRKSLNQYIEQYVQVLRHSIPPET